MLANRDKKKVQEALVELRILANELAPLNKGFTSEDLNIIHALAYALFKKGEEQEAKRIFQQLVSLKPFEDDYWHGLALCWQTEKKYQEALKAWNIAALLRNGNPGPHFYLAECYLALGDMEKGSKSFDACQERLSKKDHTLQKKLENLSLNFKELVSKNKNRREKVETHFTLTQKEA